MPKHTWHTKHTPKKWNMHFCPSKVWVCILLPGSLTVFLAAWKWHTISNEVFSCGPLPFSTQGVVITGRRTVQSPCSSSSTSWEEVDTISLHTLGAQQNFGAPSSVYKICVHTIYDTYTLWRRRSGERVLLRPRRWLDRAGLPTVNSSDWNQIILHFLKTHKIPHLSFKLVLEHRRSMNAATYSLQTHGKTNGLPSKWCRVSFWTRALQRRKQADRDWSCHQVVFLPLPLSPPSQLSQNFRGN